MVRGPAQWDGASLIDVHVIFQNYNRIIRARDHLLLCALLLFGVQQSPIHVILTLRCASRFSTTGWP